LAERGNPLLEPEPLFPYHHESSLHKEIIWSTKVPVKFPAQSIPSGRDLVGHKKPTG